MDFHYQHHDYNDDDTTWTPPRSLEHSHIDLHDAAHLQTTANSGAPLSPDIHVALEQGDVESDMQTSHLTHGINSSNDGRPSGSPAHLLHAPETADHGNSHSVSETDDIDMPPVDTYDTDSLPSLQSLYSSNSDDAAVVGILHHLAPSADDSDSALQTDHTDPDGLGATHDMPPSEPVPPPSRASRRTRVEDDEDVERDRRHPSQRSTPNREHRLPDSRDNPTPNNEQANPNRRPNVTHHIISGIMTLNVDNDGRVLGPNQGGAHFHFARSPPFAPPNGDTSLPPPPMNWQEIFEAMAMGPPSPEPENPERANRLVDALEEVPSGLVRRMERAGGVPGGYMQGSGEGLATGCAICWDSLLDMEGTGFQPTPKEAEDPSTTSDTRSPPSPPKIVTLPCAHVFHASCLIPWFSQPRQTTCPTCRFNIDPENLTYTRRPQPQPIPTAVPEPNRQTPAAAQAEPTEGESANNQTPPRNTQASVPHAQSPASGTNVQDPSQRPHPYLNFPWPTMANMNAPHPAMAFFGPGVFGPSRPQPAAPDQQSDRRPAADPDSGDRDSAEALRSGIQEFLGLSMTAFLGAIANSNLPTPHPPNPAAPNTNAARPANPGPEHNPQPNPIPNEDHRQDPAPLLPHLDEIFTFDINMGIRIPTELVMGPDGIPPDNMRPRPRGARPRRERKQWTLPPAPGPSLRQRVEEKEREAGLRCFDVSCGLGPFDDDPCPELSDAMLRQLSIRPGKGNEAAGTSVCNHTFHPGCLVSAQRVAGWGVHAPSVADASGEVQVACPICRATGCVSTGEWSEGVRALA